MIFLANTGSCLTLSAIGSFFGRWRIRFFAAVCIEASMLCELARRFSLHRNTPVTRREDLIVHGQWNLRPEP